MKADTMLYDVMREIYVPPIAIHDVLPTDSPSTARSLVRTRAIHPLVFPGSSHR